MKMMEVKISPMPYIPKEHAKYGLLPMCRQMGGEVFSYPVEFLDELQDYLPDKISLMPYGYDSYEDYFSTIDEYISEYAETEEAVSKFESFKKAIAEMNVKEEWSVLRYKGETDKNVFGLTHGQAYYWPCSKSHPEYEGVIDDEEFTSYLYPTNALLWEILEDPTGMAHRTIYGV